MIRLILFALTSLIGGVAAIPQPNVLFIAVDDLRPELGCYGSRAVTPNLDGLAESGLVFGRAYCNQAVCGASRLALMLGLYPEHTNERSFHVTDWRQRWPDVVTLNQHLTAHGYTTVGLGKIYHGSGGNGVDREHWTRWLNVRGNARYADPDNAATHREASKRPKRSGRGTMRGPLTEFADVPDNTYADGARADEAVAQLATLAEAKEPFFLAVGFTKPHLPFIAPQRYWDLYERDSFALPPNQAVPPGYPSWASNASAGEMLAYSDYPQGILPSAFPEALNKRLIHGYLACVSYMDAQVGRLLQALNANGLADNTVVIFWSDHGWKLGDHASWCKHTNFECDTRVPLIVRHPDEGTAQGRTLALVELIDLYPTLCDVLGLEKPDHLQGKSFAALLKEPQRPHRASAYSSYPHRADQGVGNVIGHSLRTARHRYTEWWQRESDRVVDRVLTEIESDPSEVTNCWEENTELVSELSAQLRQRVLSVRPWIDLFDGDDLSGWKANTDPDAFRVVDGLLRAQATDPTLRSHLFYSGDDAETLELFRDFELEAVVQSELGSNSGIFFHTDHEPRDEKLHLKNGYEIQLNSTEKEKRKTGSLYAVVDVSDSIIPDETKWHTVKVKVLGQRIQCWLNGKEVIDYTEPDKVERPANLLGRVLRAKGGAIALQAHDTDSVYYFKSIRVRKL
jgi:iduronate 2-sulfatase